MSQFYDLENTGPEVQDRLDQTQENKQDVATLEEKVTAIENEIGESGQGGNTINARLDTLETAVGSGGSVDERIAAAETEIIGGASSDYNTLGKVEGELEDTYRKNETYSKTELDNLITTPNVLYVTVIATSGTTDVTTLLPATGAADTVYRVGNWDGTQYDTTMYALYAWNGTAYICLAVRSFVGEVYDISVNHPDGQGNPTPYADLTTALGTSGANIPADIRRGGMSIKFIQGTVQSSDNKYVQYRLVADTFTTIADYWENNKNSLEQTTNDLELHFGSANLLARVVQGKYMNLNGEEGLSPSYTHTNLIPCKEGCRYLFCDGITASQCRFITAYNSDMVAVPESGLEYSNFIIIPSGIAYIAFSFSSSVSNAAVYENFIPSSFVAYNGQWLVAKDEFLQGSSIIPNDVIKNNSETQNIKEKLQLVVPENWQGEIEVGKYCSQYGAIITNSSYMLGSPINVLPGETYYMYLYNGSQYVPAVARYVTAYDARGICIPLCAKENVTSYTVPNGIYSIRITVGVLYSQTTFMVTKSVTPPTAYSDYFHPYYKASVDFLGGLIPTFENDKITKNMDGIHKYYTDNDTMYVCVKLTNTDTGQIYLYHNPNSGSIGGCAISVNFKDSTISFYKAFGVFDPSSVELYEQQGVTNPVPMTLTPTLNHTYMIQYKHISGITTNENFTVPNYVVIVTDLDTLESQTVPMSADGLGNGWGIRGYNATGCDVISADYQCDEPQNVKVLFLGDSFTEGLTIWNQRQKRWCALLKDRVGKEECAINGQGGATAGSFIQWWNDYLPNLFNPAYVILECGVNGNSEAQYEEDLTTMIGLLTNAGIVPILCTVPPTIEKPNVADYNTFVLNSGYKYIDIAKALTINGDRITRNADLFLADGTHPNIDGHQKIYEIACLNVPELFRH